MAPCVDISKTAVDQYPSEGEVLTLLLVRRWLDEQKLDKVAAAFMKEATSIVQARYLPGATSNGEECAAPVQDDVIYLPWDLELSEVSIDAVIAATAKKSRKKKVAAEPATSNSDEVLQLIWNFLSAEATTANNADNGQEPSQGSSFPITCKKWKKQKHEGLTNLLGAQISGAKVEKTSAKNPKCLRTCVEGFLEQLDAASGAETKVAKTEEQKGLKRAAIPGAEEEVEWQPKPEFELPKKKKSKDEPKPDAIECREQNRRQDWNKWAKTLEGKDERLQNGFHRTGDSWGDKAFAQLSVVKGKAFVKQMQKNKRASWRGGGAIDVKVNSYFFSDSD
ncbi:unnamed protein product [Amoebophrya sp. A120]|nr:unnamed protein product [Amoebophrya sp. A120]|eukprot:GSA120T00002127001.1